MINMSNNNNQTRKDFLERIRASQAVYEKVKNVSRKISMDEVNNEAYREAVRKADENIEKEKRNTTRTIADARNEIYR